jgi:hypothetical protein
MVKFEDVWARVVAHAGDTFETKRGLPFTYQREGDALRTDRTDYSLGRGEVEKAFAHGPCDGPGDISKLVRGPAYIWAILHDPRIRGQDW